MKRYFVYITITCLVCGGICNLFSGNLMLSLGVAFGTFVAGLITFLIHILDLHMLWMKRNKDWHVNKSHIKRGT